MAMHFTIYATSMQNCLGVCNQGTYANNLADVVDQPLISLWR